MTLYYWFSKKIGQDGTLGWDSDLTQKSSGWDLVPKAAVALSFVP